jgi:hypothetical protein
MFQQALAVLRRKADYPIRSRFAHLVHPMASQAQPRPL